MNLDALRSATLRYLPATLAATGPVLAIILVAALEPSMRPQSAAAAGVPLAVAHAETGTPAIAPARLTADRHAATLRTARAIASPFYAPEKEVHVKVAPPPAIDHRPARPRPTADLKLTAIVSGRENAAIINGKVRRVGDNAADGWIVQSIDPATGVVTVRHPQDGAKQITLKPSAPPRR